VASLWLEEPVASRVEFLSAQRVTLFVSAYLCWSFLTVFLYYLIELNPPAKNNFRWLIYLLITSMAWLILITLINQSLGQFLWGQKLKSVTSMLTSMPPFLHLFNLVKVLLVYCACAGIFFYLRMQESRFKLLELGRKHMENLEKQSRFQLQALQSHLSPHFLFNCLNTISGLARSQDTEAITSTIAHLGGLLRYALEATSQTQVYLDDEIRFTQNYVALQQNRFEGCFQFDLQTQLSDTYKLCPPFCIQTLVENIFSHNELSRTKPISIRVKITEQNGLIKIAVENSPRIPCEFESTGTGLQNLRERLYLLYKKEADLKIIETQANFTATIIFPASYEHD
jgi:sensor histidine kinase YesM